MGYPVIVKPDNGCGAEATYKLKNEQDLEAFYARLPAESYIMEEFIDGTIVSFDGVADSHCVPIFYTSEYFPHPHHGHRQHWRRPGLPGCSAPCRRAPAGHRVPHHKSLWRQEPVFSTASFSS